MQTSFTELYNASHKAILSNCIKTERGSYFRAGPHQFGSFWTRDFCLAVPGILALGSANLNLAVRDHLSRILNSLDADLDVAPRMFDSIPSAWRVVAHTVGRNLSLGRFTGAPSEPVRPEYKGEHGTFAMDANVLTLIASAQYIEACNDYSWRDQFQTTFQRALHFYQRCREKEILVQSNYEDWQDTAKRNGSTSYLNLLYFHAINYAAKILNLNVQVESASDFRLKLLERFFHRETGLLRALAGRQEIGLDSNLLAINLGFWPNEEELQQSYQSLKKHSLWQNFAFPGCPTYPHYPRSDVSWTAKCVGLRHYHDGMLWTWLGGEAAKAAKRAGDHEEATRILNCLQRLAVRDGTVYEVYDLSPETKPFTTLLYRSEGPFTWGAGKILEALSA